MTLDQLIRGRGGATETLATLATCGFDQSLVAKVAAVAVANPKKPEGTFDSGRVTQARLLELRRLIDELYWDVSQQERQAELSRCADVFDDALRMYQGIWREYHQAGELPGQPNWLGAIDESRN